jgi:soluble lytic murein transglycosylase
VNTRSIHYLLILAAAVVAAACHNSAPQPLSSERESLLDQAFTLAESDPGRAASMFADAGPGASLEVSRMAVWADCLEKIDAEADTWRRYLDDRPPEDLATQARMALISVLIENNSYVEATNERMLLPEDDQTAADELLYASGDPNFKIEAARRLVVRNPSFLIKADRDLDRRLAASLSPQQHLDRARSLRLAGRPKQAASELRRLKWRGEHETTRRRELARAELSAGSPSRALNVLPSGSSAGAEDHLLRSQAFRNRAWHLFPGRSHQNHFRDCVMAAGLAIDVESDGDHDAAAHVLRLECATQIGQLEVALDSWRWLESNRSTDSRREWLGRRLGVALAWSGKNPDTVRALSRTLKSQERCLRYWMAVSSNNATELQALADVGIADLYGRWSRETISHTSADLPNFSPPVRMDEPPRSVERLLAAGLKSEALRQWRRMRRSRHSTPSEAIAAAELAADHGWPTDSIRWLRSGFPELGTVNIDEAPENAIASYLPLRWTDGLATAARESGLDPWLIAGVARQESGFVAQARSPRGAIGVLQLLPSTGRLHARALGLGSQPDLRDPELNLRLGARELGFLMHRFGAVEPALAAYNAGFARVRGWWKKWPDRQRFTEEIPVPETYNYVRRVIYLSEAYRLVYREEWRKTR